MPTRTFRDTLAELDARSQSAAEKGRLFERLVKAFMQQDKTQSERFAKVWRWSDWPGNGGRPDTGIDLVAEESDTGDLVAIQCKFYSENSAISLEQLNKFLTAYGSIQFASGIMVSTTGNWTRNAEAAIRQARTKPVSRWGPDIFENSSIDWETFSLNRPTDLTRRATKTLRDYQDEALRDTLAGFAERDRGKLIMACGSGKTFTALRVAERQVGAGGTALFLTPSISLLGQSLLDWANDADIPLKTFAVCSDVRAGRRGDDDGDISPYDLRDAPSTDPDRLVERYQTAKSDDCMSVVFSTYQSLDVVSKAQEKGLPKFDLIICDEAHRTTGVSLNKQSKSSSESGFQRIHDDGFIAADKRLYMTATPRIYGDRAKRKANENRLVVASMDDERTYGKEFHRLSFGQAIDKKILSPYKVVIFNVDQEEVGIDLDHLLSDKKVDINMDNAARMVGCWNGLGKRGAEGSDFSADPRPARRAVAFSNTIKQSEHFMKHFSNVIDSCLAAKGDRAENQLRCDVRHVDGGQNAQTRSESLAWLRQEPDDGVCRILSNARCLAEGIDVPALDAILFLHPRKSEIDVVQAVGRVMRRAEGKKLGYIILPIVQAPGATAQQTIGNSAYNTIWQVINAISAHDDRFEARINQLALTHGGSKAQRYYPKDNDIGRSSEPDDPNPRMPLIFVGSPEMRDAILARIVDKYADPGYWEKWAESVHGIAQRHEFRIRALLNKSDSDARPAFDNFLANLKGSLNNGITENDAIGMLSQHLITKPVFDALFEDYAFTRNNPVSQAMQGILESLQARGLEKETEGLDNFYREVQVCVRDITDAASKQKVIAELYQRFFKLALPETAQNLGIVYTPVEVVDYIIRSVEDALQQEFGVSVRDKGVHVIDPFVGTGTFISRLLSSGLICEKDLRRKYETELHANDIMLLAYYVAAVNIESTWHDLVGAEEHQPFDGIVLTDTFQSVEDDAAPPMDKYLFPNNNERIERQKGLDIRVIIGNPPWSATNNREYPTIDRKIRRRYAEPSAAGHLSALYDPYVRAIRLASDRVQSSENGGIIAFVTNGGFIDSNAFDGFRKALVAEFHAVYCYNLRGNARTSGEQRQKEGGGVFGSGSKAGVAILILVKKPGKSDGATIYYHDIGDYLSRQDKLDILTESRLAKTDWQVITPDKHGDWIRQRNPTYATFRPLIADGSNSNDDNALAPVFERKTLGIVTARDAWCYNLSQETLRGNIKRSIDFYNSKVKAFQKTQPTGSTTELQAQAKAFVGKTPEQFHWDAKNLQHLANGRYYEVETTGFRIGAYRPFFKQRLYFAPEMNNSIRDFPNLYPSPNFEVSGINLTREGAGAQFHALITDAVPDYHLTGDTTHLPRYRFTPAPPQYIRS